MNEPLIADETGPTPTPNPEALRVLIFYEDFATGLRAKSILDRMADRMGSETECRQDWCRLDLLRLPAVRRDSLRNVATADLILVSVHGDSVELRDFADYFEQWTRGRGDRSGALVLSVDTDARELAGTGRALLRFRVVAAKARLVLFPHFGDAPVSNALLPAAAGHSERN